MSRTVDIFLTSRIIDGEVYVKLDGLIIQVHKSADIETPDRAAALREFAGTLTRILDNITERENK